MIKTFVFVNEMENYHKEERGQQYAWSSRRNEHFHKDTMETLERSIDETISDFAKKENLREVKRSIVLSSQGSNQNSTVITIVVTSEFELELQEIEIEEEKEEEKVSSNESSMGKFSPN